VTDVSLVVERRLALRRHRTSDSGVLARAGTPSVALLVGLWVVGGAVLALQLGRHAVSRSQEARVLQTAREMLDAPLEGWLLPQVNGHPRMQKPPLAYWLTALSYGIFGTSNEAAGRVPAVLAGWFTLGLTGAIALRLFGRRAAFFAGAALLGSILFFRHARLAETDVLVMLFVAAGCWAAWQVTRPGASKAEMFAWSHAAAAAVGLAAMTKGPPALYPLLFLLAVCIVERRWHSLRTFVLSGAPLTVALIAGPWFWHVWTHPTSAALVTDLRTSVEGGKGHWDWPFVYAYQLPLAAAPWTGVVLVAVATAVPRVRRDLRLRRLLIWVGVILLPLCLWGNKQRHYLLPLLPPLMIMTGWYIDRGLRATSFQPGTQLPRVLRMVAVLTAVACAIAVPVILIIGPVMRGSRRVPEAADVLLALALIAGVCGSVVMTRTRGLAAGIATFALAGVLIVYVSLTSWSVTLDPVNPRVIADAIRERYGEAAPLAFVRREYLPLCYNLDRIIPVAKCEAELAELTASHSAGLVAIDVSSEGGCAMDVGLLEELRFTDAEGKTYAIGPMKSAE
jgi:4-amino-4-deoxy-L-arabinose transferase-like glycosyltransferase